MAYKEARRRTIGKRWRAATMGVSAGLIPLHRTGALMFTTQDPSRSTPRPAADPLGHVPLALHAAALERGLSAAQKQVDELQRWLAH